MNKAVSSFLAVSALLAAPGALPHFASGFAQTPAPAAGQVSMDPPEYAVYDAAMNKQTTPQTQAPALEAYLQQYPKSTVKNSVLERIMIDYFQMGDPNKSITAADNVLQVAPDDYTALTIEAVSHYQVAQGLTDATAKQTALDASAGFAQKALAAPKPAELSDADFQKQKAGASPTFYSIIGNDDFAKKDYPDAITAFKQEMAAAPPAATQTPGTTLQDIYYLAQAYYSSTPPDYVDCTFYAILFVASVCLPFCVRVLFSTHEQNFGNGGENGCLQAGAHGTKDRGSALVSDADIGASEKRSGRSRLFQTRMHRYEQ
jgi:tetratricopeptide (TPR) repeat protein